MTSAPSQGDEPRLLYEDDQLVIVDKPAGVPVHPSPRWPDGTLVQWLWRRYDGTCQQVQLAHRIDRETSGVVVATRDGDSNRRMHAAFAQQEVQKRYVALVVGEPAWDSRVAEGPIGKDKSSAVRMRMAVTPDGAPSRTELVVRERLGGYALIEAAPRTGRQHQIRVHLSHLGHPIVGDKIYGADERLFIQWHEGREDDAMWERLKMRRHALHAESLTLPHPWRRGVVEVVAPLPEDLRSRADALRRAR